MTPTPRAGHYIQTIEGHTAFVPSPLPPEPSLDLADNEMITLQSEADLALGKLSGLGQVIPNIAMFIVMYMFKEAVVSSQIEGTQSTLMNVLEDDAVAPNILRARLLEQYTDHELDLNDDLAEVVNYVKAMDYGLRRLAELPLSLRLIRELHRILLAGVRGQNRQRGQFRDMQNWIGSQGAPIDRASYVPPPHQEMLACLNNLEEFLHADVQSPVLIKAGLIHCQFEMIHPFADGNGRIGRLLIPFYLCQQGILREPLLYISHYFKQHRRQYYDRLRAVSSSDDWEGWLKFFLRGVAEVAREAAETATQVLKLHEKHREETKKMSGKRASELLDHLYQAPTVSVPGLRDQFAMSYGAANSLIGEFEAAGILTEMTGQSYNRRYLYRDYVDLFTEGTEPL